MQRNYGPSRNLLNISKRTRNRCYHCYQDDAYTFNNKKTYSTFMSTKLQKITRNYSKLVQLLLISLQF